MPVSLETAAIFCGAAFILSLAPGPDNLFVLTQSAAHGAKAGFVTIAGLMTGVCLHTLAVALGVAALLQAAPRALLTLKIIGAAYLVYLAFQAFRSGLSRADTQCGVFPGYAPLYRRGAIMSVCNPKLCLFFLALLPQFVDATRGPVFWQFICLGMLFIACAVIVFGAVALAGGLAARWLNASHKGQQWIQRISGCIFLGLAAFLLFAP